MKAFTSDDELKRYLAELAKKRQALGVFDESGTLDSFISAEPAQTVVGLAKESVTNTQHEGVDEGGIVKVHGDHLVILRRDAFSRSRSATNS